MWRGTDETIKPEYFVKALNTLPYHYWTVVHEFVIDTCENLIMYVDSELRDKLTAEGERNLDSLFGDRILHVDTTDWEWGERVHWENAYYTIE